MKRKRGCEHGEVGQLGCSAVRPEELERQKAAGAQFRVRKAPLILFFIKIVTIILKTNFETYFELPIRWAAFPWLVSTEEASSAGALKQCLPPRLRILR